MSTTRPTGLEDAQHTSADATRRGAHRARPTPLMAALPAVAVVVVVVMVAVGVYTLLGGGSDTESDGTDSAVAGSTLSPSPSGEVSPSAEASPSEEPTVEETTEDKPKADKTLEITVLNNTSTSGLAAQGAAKLEAKGWNVVGTGNHTPQGSVATTTVFYGNPDFEVTAQAVSKLLGVGGISQSSEIAGDGIAVVLAGDFTP